MKDEGQNPAGCIVELRGLPIPYGLLWKFWSAMLAWVYINISVSTLLASENQLKTKKNLLCLAECYLENSQVVADPVFALYSDHHHGWFELWTRESSMYISP